MRMPASPRSVRTACSIRPFGRASRRQAETDCRDICRAPIVGPQKHDADSRGEPAWAKAFKESTELLVTLRAPPAAPDGAGGGDDAGGANGHAAWAVVNPPPDDCQLPDRVVDTARDAGQIPNHDRTPHRPALLSALLRDVASLLGERTRL